MNDIDETKRRCGICGSPLRAGEGVGPCRQCWEIHVPYSWVSDQVKDALRVMAEYHASLGIMGTARGRRATGDSWKEKHREILANYSEELAGLFSLRKRQRELCMKLELRRNMKRV